MKLMKTLQQVLFDARFDINILAYTIFQLRSTVMVTNN